MKATGEQTLLDRRKLPIFTKSATDLPFEKFANGNRTRRALSYNYDLIRFENSSYVHANSRP